MTPLLRKCGPATVQGRRRRLVRGSVRAAALAAMGLVIGCAHPTPELRLPVEIPEAFSAAGERPAAEAWWESFDDAMLNELIEQSLTENLDLLAAWDRLAQARAAARRTEATLWPWVDAGATARRTRFDSPIEYVSSYSADVAATYEVDLWGQLESRHEAAWLDAAAQRDAVATLAISLSAAVADTWYRLGEAKALDRIAEQQIETNQQVLEAVTARFRKGQAAAADVLRQRQLVIATEALRIALGETIELLQHQLSLLIGRAPSPAWGDLVIELPPLGPAPAPGVPAAVLWRRPDVRRAYRLVQAADQRLAAAVAEQYPRLSVSASVGSTAASSRDLFSDWLATLAGNIAQPLFDAGYRVAEVDRQAAAVQEALHVWGQVSLDALQEVEDALVRERQSRLAFENLLAQLKLAQETAQRNRDRYVKGQIDYIRVLESLQSLQSLERSVISAQRAVVQNRIALHRAIAGDLELVEPDDEAVTTQERAAADVTAREDAEVRL